MLMTERPVEMNERRKERMDADSVSPLVCWKILNSDWCLFKRPVMHRFVSKQGDCLTADVWFRARKLAVLLSNQKASRPSFETLLYTRCLVSCSEFCSVNWPSLTPPVFGTTTWKHVWFNNLLAKTSLSQWMFLSLSLEFLELYLPR